MSTRAQNIKAGVFIVCGLAVIAAVFAAMARKHHLPLDPYYILFKDSVQGLEKESAVLYQGVEVGKVLDISVTAENLVLIEVGIDPDRLTPREGIHATLSFSSILRGLQINLGGGDPASPPLPRHSHITARPSVIQDLAKELPEILLEIRSILAKIDGSLEEVGRTRLKEIVEATDRVMETTRDSLEELSIFLRSARESLAVTEREMGRTMDEVAQTLRPLRRTLETVAEDPSVLLRGPSRPRDAYVR